MTTQEEKKEFALSQLAPYFADPTTCGFDKEKRRCEYLTADGRMCVAGKNMLNPKDCEGDIETVLFNNTQQEVFKPEVVDILTDDEWIWMQNIHDALALNSDEDEIKVSIENLELFTYEELKERAEQLKAQPTE